MGVQLQATSFQSELKISQIVRLYAGLYGVELSGKQIAEWGRIEHIRREGGSILLTTHSMGEAQAVCDRVAIIDNGTC
jgi:ABC-type uncharacterized transport system ATPase subunit